MSRPGEVAVQAVVVQSLASVSDLARDWSLAVLPGTPSIIMSRLNSLARTTSVRSSRPRGFQIEDELGDRAVDLLLQPRDRRVAVLVRVPVEERDVLGRHLDEAGPGFDQPAGEQAALAEAAGVVLVEALLRLLRQIERVALGRARAGDGRSRASGASTRAGGRSRARRCGLRVDQFA